MANTCHVGMGYIYENISEHHIIGDYVPNECFPIQRIDRLQEKEAYH